MNYSVIPKAAVYINSYEETLIENRNQMKILPQDPGPISILVTMQETISDITVRELRKKQRKCLFKDEANFKYFKDDEYSYTTCMKECRIKKALNICGCLPPVYLNEWMTNLTKCEFESLKCLKDQSFVDSHDCNCVLPCDMTSVYIESISRKAHPEGYDSVEYSINLKHFPLVTYQREVKFGFVDFLVAFGSILALFLSFSFLSLIELILYLFRMFATKIKKGDEDATTNY